MKTESIFLVVAGLALLVVLVPKAKAKDAVKPVRLSQYGSAFDPLPDYVPPVGSSSLPDYVQELNGNKKAVWV